MATIDDLEAKVKNLRERIAILDNIIAEAAKTLQYVGRIFSSFGTRLSASQTNIDRVP